MADRLLAGTCQATYGKHRCCRYEGHPGDHEEWVDRSGDRVTPIKGHLMGSWPIDHQATHNGGSDG